MKKYSSWEFFKEASIFAIFWFSIELFVRIIEHFSLIDYSVLRILLSSFFLSFFVYFFLSFFHKKQTRFLLECVFLFIVTIYAFIQVGFRNFLGMYISIGTSGQMSAVFSYVKSFLFSIPIINYVLFLPFLLFVFFLFFQKKGEKLGRFSFFPYKILILCFFLFGGSFWLTLNVSFFQNPMQLVSNRTLFLVPTNSSIVVNQFGTTMYGILDVRHYFFPIEVVSLKEEEEEEKDVLDSLWLSVIEEEKDVTKLALHKYFQSRTISKKNDYTGYFEGKNVIVVMMESVNLAIELKEYFPNFAKMLEHGWYFKNNYSPRNACATGDNEFSGMTSLYPLNTSCTVNVKPNNTYFTSIFNRFKEKGYITSSYHDLDSTYYNRDIFHKNLGSEAYYDGNRLGIKFDSKNYNEWPSDVEFIEKSFPLFSKSTPFMAWLTTVTPHQPYESSSVYGDYYIDLFQDTDYSDSLKRYLSKLKITDDALGVLMDLLEEKNLLSDTVIVLYGDHYPYGLSNDDVQDALSYDITPFYEIERTPFLIYNSELEAQALKQKTFYMNILPTLLNLFDLDYDSRFYMGEDIFSEDFSNRVVFADGSWEDEIARYNALTSEIIYFSEDVTYTLEEIQKINFAIYQKKEMSKLAIEENYFAYLEEKLNEKQKEKENE